MQLVLIFTKKVGDKDIERKVFLKVYLKESDNQSHFTMPCLCIQTENTISMAESFSLAQIISSATYPEPWPAKESVYLTYTGLISPEGKARRKNFPFLGFSSA